MARVNLDAKFFSDARFIHLGHLLGGDKFSARGRVLGVWHYCYEHVKDILTAQEIDTQAEWFGTNGNSFAELLVTADLAEKVDDKYRIKGALERFKYILQCREAAARGGKRSATVRQASAQANGSPDAQANGQATLKHALALVPDLVPDSKTLLSEVKTSDQVETPEKDARSEKQLPEDSVPFLLANKLWQRIVSRHPTHRPPDLQKWAKVVDLMIRRDHRQPEEVERVIDWAQDDDIPRGPGGFCWATNILSTQKLRDQYDTLVMKMKAGNGARAEGKKTLVIELPEGGTEEVQV